MSENSTKNGIVPDVSINRLPNGRFGKGNPGSSGRPKRKTEVVYQNILMSECTEDVWAEIVKTAIDYAKDGDAKAREFLAKHVLGPNLGRPEALRTAQVDLLKAIEPSVEKYVNRAVQAELERLKVIDVDGEDPPYDSDNPAEFVE